MSYDCTTYVRVKSIKFFQFPSILFTFEISETLETIETFELFMIFEIFMIFEFLETVKIFEIFETFERCQSNFSCGVLLFMTATSFEQTL